MFEKSFLSSLPNCKTNNRSKTSERERETRLGDQYLLSTLRVTSAGAGTRLFFIFSFHVGPSSSSIHAGEFRAPRIIHHFGTISPPPQWQWPLTIRLSKAFARLVYYFLTICHFAAVHSQYYSQHHAPWNVDRSIFY